VYALSLLTRFYPWTDLGLVESEFVPLLASLKGRRAEVAR